MAASYHDWENDPRPFRDVLRAWIEANGYGGAEEAAEALGVRFNTLKGWLYQSRPCPYETAFRRLMRAIDRGLA
jgi:hypothetical protein